MLLCPLSLYLNWVSSCFHHLTVRFPCPWESPQKPPSYADLNVSNWVFFVSITSLSGFPASESLCKKFLLMLIWNVYFLSLSLSLSLYSENLSCFKLCSLFCVSQLSASLLQPAPVQVSLFLRDSTKSLLLTLMKHIFVSLCNLLLILWVLLLGRLTKKFLSFWIRNHLLTVDLIFYLV